MKTNSFSIIILVVLLFFVFTSTPIQDLIFSFREFIEPNLHERIEKEWQEKPTNFLLKQLKSKNYVYIGIANNILYERKEQRALPILRKLLISKNDNIRDMAFASLAYFNDKESTNYFMEIANTGAKNEDYFNALTALSIMKYEKVYSYALKLAESKSAKDRTYAVIMLENFKKLESLPILKKIANSDPEWYIQENAKQAIKKIESQN